MSGPCSTILIVDDEGPNRRLLEAQLAPEGYLTQTASNGAEALASVARQMPDLILLDVMMPGMDGYQVAQALKANPDTSNIPIIMVTALMDHAAQLEGLAAGAEEFLSKPVNRAELWLRVRNLLRLKALSDFFQSQSTVLETKVQERTRELQLFRSAMDATADAIFLVRRKTMRFVEVNATACRMLGYTRKDFLEAGPTMLFGHQLARLEHDYDDIIAGRSANESTEVELQRKDGSTVEVEIHRHALHSTDWIIVAVVRDVTNRNATDKRLNHLAHFDALTGLPNRALFYGTLKRTLALASTKDWTVAVLFIDLDNFKDVNDSLGHAVGDELLCQFSSRLLGCVRTRDTVGRLGGDEFAVILLAEDGQHGAAEVAAKIWDLMRAPFDLADQEVFVTASIGIAVHPDDASDPETLIKYADTAMYRAKQAGRDTFRYFTAQMNADVLARRGLEAALRRAVENSEFVLHYQPKMRLHTNRIVGVEALLRWQRPGHGMVSPGHFIPALEESGLIVDVGRWVIATACRQAKIWADSEIGPLQISVNVAGRQFLDRELEGDVSDALCDYHCTGELLELELTESSLMTNTEHTVNALQGLKRLGVEISIDDFGTGYSSLAYLQRFPIDKLKIDIAFVRSITTNADDAAIALTIIRLAQSLKMVVIAEGVETAAQLDFLRRNGCDQIQGYYVSRPLPVHELEAMIREWPPAAAEAEPPLGRDGSWEAGHPVPIGSAS
jgi:diguanylate cyclase (GGDEF)-like protein/PAS domain S-box-containing protein